MVILKSVNRLVPIPLTSDNAVEFEFQVNNQMLVSFLNILKSHSLTRTTNLVEITAVDLPNNMLRFYVSYFLLSLEYNARVRVSIQTNELQPVISATSIFNSANWMEREVWDLFGIFFADHPDLRRILTDYGFIGHPLRKDFPLSGFVDIFYNDAKKLLVYEPVELAQSFRKFSFLSPWIQDK
jgi:NADH:ubiquinone oxidoreductase subunit C